METTKKLSIIVPVYNAEKYLKKCLNRLIEQTYKNIEVIIVNDCSEGQCEEIAKEYQAKDERIKYIKHEKNKGLFKARITGASIATGDYITFLDSDDYVSIDYYRTLMASIIKNNADIAWGNMVLEYDNGKREVNNLFDAKHLTLTGEECLEHYFNQEGLSFDWHTIWNKIYTMNIWKKALKHYEKVTNHLLMTEDFAFSTVLFYYANKLVKEESNDCIFYCKHEISSTSISDLKFKKFKKNITDLNTSFDFVENFLKEEKIFEKYKEKFYNWKNLYANQQISYVKQSKIMNEKEKKNALALIKEFYSETDKKKTLGYLQNITTKWNDKLEKVKKKICSSDIKCVSFDVFDTLIQRPFLNPSDLFALLNKYFIEYTNGKSGMDFSKIRVFCEQLTRDRLINDKKQDVSLDDIYKTLEEEYEIDKDVLTKMKQKEIEYEIRFSTRRNTGYELYTLALNQGKHVVFTSDMYLPMDIIKKILEKNGYVDEEKIYLSSDAGLTKGTGDLYRYVINDLGINPEEMVHIGDNYKSDYLKAKEIGINAIHFPKASLVASDERLTNCFESMLIKNMPFWRDNANSMQFFGIRTMIAIVANKYFDNPFRAFNNMTDFNADPYLIGYYALGMYLFGITKWLLDETENKGYTNLVFMARDGYLPMISYKEMKKFYKNVPEEKYLYVSRKSLMPIIIMDKLDFYKLQECINITNHTPLDILNYVKPCLKDNVDFEEVLLKNNINPNKKLKNEINYNKFIKVVIDNFYDENKQKKNLELYRSYFEDFYKEKSATFDIGYSARPELFLSNLCKKPIDTFFMNINSDEAIKHANKGNFKLKTFFSGKPSITGLHYETMISALAPSCIGYDLNNNKVNPVFEKYNKTYSEEFIISIMQSAAMEFIKDITDTFGSEIKELYYEKYYVSLPIMAYINSSKELDKAIFNTVYFEDDVRLKKQIKMTEQWNSDLRDKNQLPMRDLLYGSGRVIRDGEYLDYNRYPDLEHHSKFARLLYYAVFDRETFGRRMKDIFKHTKILYGIIWFIYFILRTMKRVIYFIIHSITGFNKKQKQKQEQKKKDDEDYENDEDEE